jgi:hypothetical protein
MIEHAGRHWRDAKTAMAYYRAEGFVVGQAKCRACKHTWNAVLESFDPCTFAANLHCPECHFNFGNFWPGDWLE